MLRQFEIAADGIRPYNALASAPIAVFVSVFLMYPLGQSSWFFSPHSETALPIPAVLPGFHNWTLNPFHMMGVAGVLSGLRCDAVMAPQLKRCLKTVMLPHLPCLPTSRKKPALDGYRQPLLVTDFGIAFPTSAALHAVCARHRLVMSAVGVVGLALNLRLRLR